MTKSDLIRRADVVRLLVERYKFTTSEATEILSQLPSAEADWIPCSEGLPKTGDSIIATYSDGEVGIIWDARPKLWGAYMKNSHLIYPIAWMPRPKPYREDGEA